MSLHSFGVRYCCAIQGLQPRGYITLYDATTNIMQALYHGVPDRLQETLAMQRRDEEIRDRYSTGVESIPDLAKVFDLSNARVHQILHHR